MKEGIAFLSTGLTRAHLDELRDLAFGSEGAPANPVAYYQRLRDFEEPRGRSYRALALSVVQNDPVSGAVAIAFAQSHANGPINWTALNHDLMVADHSDAPARIIVNIAYSNDLDALEAAVTEDGFGGADHLLSIENIIGTSKSDWFTVPRAPIDGLRINGGGHKDGRGDTIDFGSGVFDHPEGYSPTRIEIDLGQQAVDFAVLELEGVEVGILDFENVTGGALDDVIRGSSERSILIGGVGDDELFAVANADGAAGDVLVGGAGEDELTILAPEEGYDRGAPVVVWGGDGKDVIRFDASANDDLSAETFGIVVVMGENVTAENVAKLALEDLDLDDRIDWSKISAVLINPDDEGFEPGGKRTLDIPLVVDTTGDELLSGPVYDTYCYPRHA